MMMKHVKDPEYICTCAIQIQYLESLAHPQSPHPKWFFFWNDGFLSLNFRSSRAIKQIHLINFCVLKIHYIALQTESCDTTTNYNYNTLVCIARCISSSLLSPHTPKYSSVSYYSVYYFLLRWCLYSSSRLFWPVLRSFCIMASTTMYKDPYQ